MIAALAIASAIMGQAVVQAVGLQGGGVAYGAQKPPAKKPVGAKRALAAMPLAFVRNEGQTDARVRFYAVGNHYAFFATPSELMLSLTREKPATQLALALRFVGHSTKVTTTGARTIPGKVNYLRSTDPSKWQTKLSRYRDVVYTGLWPRIDLHLHQAAGALKYEFHVHPGARTSDIRLAYAGATGLALDKKGALRIKTGLGTLRDAPPVSYQRIAGKRVAVHSRYVLRGSGKGKAPRFAFAVGSYRHDHVLIIDPGIQFTTFLGGAAHETGNGIAVDGAGNSLHRGHDAVARLPDDGRRIQAHRLGAEQLGRLRHEAERGRHGARLLDVRRRQQPGLRQRHRDRRLGQRVRHRDDEVVELPDHRQRVRPHASTSRRTARAARPTSPTGSCSSSTQPARR